VKVKGVKRRLTQNTFSRLDPTAFMVYPDMLPSPFAPQPDGSERESRLEKLSRERTHAVIQTLLKMENDAKTIPQFAKLNIFGRKAQQKRMDSLEEMGELTSKVLTAPGARGSLGAQVFLRNLEKHFYSPIEFTKAESRLVGVPKAIITGIVQAVEGPNPISAFFPNIMNRGKVISHIQKISSGDEFLVNEDIDLSTIGSTHLLAACNERLIGGLGKSDDELRESLGEWLNLAVKEPAERVQQTGQFYNAKLARLSLLCYYALDSSRDPRSSSYLPRLMYQGQLLQSNLIEDKKKGK